jgi:hypothetical protein
MRLGILKAGKTLREITKEFKKNKNFMYSGGNLAFVD